MTCSRSVYSHDLVRQLWQETENKRNGVLILPVPPHHDLRTISLDFWGKHSVRTGCGGYAWRQKSSGTSSSLCVCVRVLRRNNRSLGGIPDQETASPGSETA